MGMIRICYKFFFKTEFVAPWLSPGFAGRLEISFPNPEIQLAIVLAMKYSRFEELPVWKDAIELAVRIYQFTSADAFKGRYSLKDQLERAAVSVSNNIAEGFERGSTQETLTFLYISRGSAGETRSVLCLCDRLPGFSHLRSEIQSGEHLASITTLGGLSAKLQHPRSTLPNKQDEGEN
jgi:four helix bundle protein